MLLASAQGPHPSGIGGPPTRNCVALLLQRSTGDAVLYVAATDNIHTLLVSQLRHVLTPRHLFSFTSSDLSCLFETRSANFVWHPPLLFFEVPEWLYGT